MDLETVNMVLKRPVQSGHKYGKYFASSTCTPTFLGKSDTYFTVAQMKKLAYRYKGQTKELALAEFTGTDLQTAVTNIHQFLYHHFQYELDGTEQNLKSPKCAWASRKEGMDCKSYSIFASTILQNLGVKHYFRKVKQPHLQPESWTHVYVIIPIDQNKGNLALGYLTLDATVANNVEIEFVEKHDTYMSKVSLPHIGLNAPAAASSSCKCIAHNTSSQAPAPYSPSLDLANTSILKPASTYSNQRLLGMMGAISNSEAARFNQALDRFRAFLHNLETRGVPVSVTQNALINLKKSLEKGKEPTLNELLTGDLGLGNTITAPILTNIDQLPPGSRPTIDVGGGTGFLSNIGNTVGTVSMVTSIITSIVPKDIFDKTFGAIFANGFNFKCWGASWNPKRAEEEFTKDAVLVKQQIQQVLQLQPNQLEAAINQFWVWFYSLRSTQRNWLNTSAKDCTKDGLKILIGSHDGLAAVIKSEITSYLAQLGHSIKSTLAVRKTYPPEDTGRHSLTMDVPQYKITLGNSVPNSQTPNNLYPTNPITSVPQNPINYGQQYPTGSNPTNQGNSPTVQTAGIDNKTVLLGAGLLAGFALLNKRSIN